MLLFAARRLVQAIPILLGVSLVVFGLVHIVPGNPIDMLLPPEASPEIIAQMKAAFGFRAAFFFTLFLAIRSPLKDAQSVEGEYHETALCRVDFPLWRCATLSGLSFLQLGRWPRLHPGRPRRATRDTCGPLHAQ